MMVSSDLTVGYMVGYCWPVATVWYLVPLGEVCLLDDEPPVDVPEVGVVGVVTCSLR